jgi:hypothetical protein
MIRRQTPASKHTSPGFGEVLQTAINVNYIKARPMKTRMFAGLCEDMCAEHTKFLLRIKMLVSGNSLQLVFKLADELYQYLT